MRHKRPGSCAPSLSENTFPGKGSTAMLRLCTQPCPFWPLESRCISSPTHKIKLNQLRPLATALPRGSEAATVPCRIPHSSSPHTEMRCGWEGGKEAAASSDGSIASPVLHYSEPTSQDGPQLWLRAVARQCTAVFHKETEGAPETRAGETVLEKDWPAVLSDKTGIVVGQSPTASPRNTQVQIFLSDNFIGLAALLLCQEYPVIEALPFFATEKIVLMTEHLSLPVCWLFHQATWTFH